jgi:hypothetical protein
VVRSPESYQEISKEQPEENFFICTMLRISKTYERLQEIVSKNCQVTDLGNIVSASMINGEYVSSGKRMLHKK